MSFATAAAPTQPKIRANVTFSLTHHYDSQHVAGYLLLVELRYLALHACKALAPYGRDQHTAAEIASSDTQEVADVPVTGIDQGVFQKVSAIARSAIHCPSRKHFS